MVILSFTFLFLDSVRIDLHDTLKKKQLESCRSHSGYDLSQKNILAPQQ